MPVLNGSILLETGLRTLVAALLAGSIAYLALALTRWLLPRARWDFRWLCAGIAAVWVASVTFHVLILARSFRPSAAALLLLVLCALARNTHRFRDIAFDLNRDWRSVQRIFRAVSDPRTRPLLFWLGLILLLMGFRSLLVIPLSWDGLTYHFVKAGLWVQSGSPISLEAPGGWAVYRHFFGGGESLLAWAMLPFHSDLIVGVVDWVAWTGLGLCVWTLSSQLSVRGGARLVLVLYLLTIPAVLRSVGAGYVEAPLYCGVLIAVIFTLRYRQCADLRSLFIAAASIVIATSIKITAATYGLAILICVVALEVWRPKEGRRIAIPILAGTAAGLVALMPWIVGNVATMGAPLGTIPLSIGGVTLGRLIPEMEWLIKGIPSYESFTIELFALLQIFGWLDLNPNLSIFSFPIVLAAMVLILPLARRKSDAVTILGSLVIATIWNVYQPAFAPVRIQFSWVSGRFVLPLLIAAAVVLASTWRHRPRWAVGWQTYLVLVAMLHGVIIMFAGWSATFLWLCSILTVGVVVAICFLVRLNVASRRVIGAMIALIVVSLPFVDQWKRAHRFGIMAGNEILHPIHRYWISAAQILEQSPYPVRLAFTSGPHRRHDRQLLYHMLGSRLQNEIVYVSSGIGTARLSHGSADLQMDRRSQELWVNRLNAERVTHVLSFCPVSPELQWMIDRPELFRPIVGDGVEWGLYSVGERHVLEVARSHEEEACK